MTRYIDPTPQYFDANGEVLSGGKLYFYDSGSATLKDIWYDSAKSKPAPNPITLYGDGRVPSVFLEGAYRVVLTESDGTQVWERDPVSSNLDAPFGSDWSADVVYQLSDVVRENGLYWNSLTGNNFGNRPSTDGGANWQEVSFIAGTFGDMAFTNLEDAGLITDRASLPPTNANDASSWVGMNCIPCGTGSTNTPSASLKGSLIPMSGIASALSAQLFVPFVYNAPAIWARAASPSVGPWVQAVMADSRSQVPDYFSGSLNRVGWVPKIKNPAATFTDQQWGHKVIVRTGSAFTLGGSPDNGVSVKVYNLTGSPITISPNAGSTLTALMGGSSLSGTRTLANNSWCEIFKENSDYFMIGNGIT